jgi:hypothetical protein
MEGRAYHWKMSFDRTEIWDKGRLLATIIVEEQYHEIHYVIGFNLVDLIKNFEYLKKEKSWRDVVIFMTDEATKLMCLL